jgi:hypothetical protein
VKVIVEHRSDSKVWYVMGPRKWRDLGFRDCLGAGFSREEALAHARRTLAAPPPPKPVTTRERVEL